VKATASTKMAMQRMGNRGVLAKVEQVRSPHQEVSKFEEANMLCFNITFEGDKNVKNKNNRRGGDSNNKSIPSANSGESNSKSITSANCDFVFVLLIRLHFRLQFSLETHFFVWIVR
jgi:hypothetical protein